MGTHTANPDLISEARKNLSEMDPAEWVFIYAHRILEICEMSAERPPDRMDQMGVQAIAGRVMARAARDELRKFESALGNGDAERGRKLLDAVSPSRRKRMKPTHNRMSAAVLLYFSLRDSVKAFAMSSAIASGGPAEAKRRLAEKLDRLNEIELPEGVAEDQRAKIQEKLERLRQGIKADSDPEN